MHTLHTDFTAATAQVEKVRDNYGCEYGRSRSKQKQCTWVLSTTVDGGEFMDDS
jgi:hypothetical protein